MSTSTRKRLLDAATGVLYQAVYEETDQEIAALAARLNADGWTLATTADRPDWVIRHEGVHFEEAELAAVVAAAIAEVRRYGPGL